MYFQILKYQIYLFRQYSRAGVVRFLRDVVVADDWVSLREQIEKSRHSIDNDLREIDGKTIGDIDRTMSALREKAEKFMESLTEIQVAVEVGTTIQYVRFRQMLTFSLTRNSTPNCPPQGMHRLTLLLKGPAQNVSKTQGWT
jgi:hypothetical protein